MDPKELARRVKYFQIVTSKMVETFFAGNYRSVFRGPGMEFDEVRNYYDGDEARRIDWNVTSRMGSPYIKTFREERELNLHLIVDVSPSLHSGGEIRSKMDTACLVFGILSFAAIANNDRVGAVYFTDIIEEWAPPAKGKKHVLRLIQDMLALEPRGTGSNLGLALNTTLKSLKRRGICVIISDFKTNEYFKELSSLARKHDVIAVRVNDNLDEQYPVSGLIELEDPETGETILGAGLSRNFRRDYKEYWELNRLFWLRECRRRGVDTLEINTSDDPAQKIFQFFRRRRFR